jgi:hypothetical protein
VIKACRPPEGLSERLLGSNDMHLTCKLHEGFGNQGVMGEAVGLIGRKSIAVAMV